MKVINYQTIIDDIKGDKYPMYEIEFGKEFKTQLENIRNGKDEKDNVIPLLVSGKTYGRLRLIYGEDIQANFILPDNKKVQQSLPNTSYEVVEVDADSYDNEWFTNFMKPNQARRVQMYSTSYRPDDNKIIISAMIIKG